MKKKKTRTCNQFPDTKVCKEQKDNCQMKCLLGLGGDTLPGQDCLWIRITWSRILVGKSSREGLSAVGI